MRRIAIAVLLVGSSACASKNSTPDLGPSSPTSTAAMTNPTSGLGLNVAIQNTSAANKTVISMPIDKVWDALVKAYTLASIQPTDLNATTRSIGNASFKVRRKLGDLQLRNALDCGGDNSNPNADSYELTLSVRSQLSTDASGGTLLQTFVEGTGKNAMTNSGNQVPCYSSGGIETRIVDLVKSGLGLTTPVVPKKGN